MMKQSICLLPAVAAGFLWAAQPALSAEPDCDKMQALQKLEGQVIKVEPEQGKLSLRASDGTLHEFHASRETLQDYKPGDTIKANLRKDPKCERR